MDEKDGVWRTVRGHRVFITKDGTIHSKNKQLDGQKVGNSQRKIKYDYSQDDEVLSFNDCKNRLDKVGIKLDKSTNDMDTKLLTDQVKQLETLTKKYPEIQKFIKEKSLTISYNNLDDDALAVTSGGTDSDMSIILSSKAYDKYLNTVIATNKNLQTKYSMPSSGNMRTVYSLTHEFGHVIQNKFQDEYNKAHQKDYKKMQSRLVKAANNGDYDGVAKIASEWQSKVMNTIASEITEIAEKKNADFKLQDNLSTYSRQDSSEFFAECFANYECGNPNELGNAMGEWLKQNLKKKGDK